MRIQYEAQRAITVSQFTDLLKRSTLAERRPVEDSAVMQAMLDHTSLLCTAWDGPVLVGVARSLTDFAYCCYLADLAVDEQYQRHGIGRELIRQTQSQLHAGARIILLAAPKAVEYYPRIGFEQHPSAWTIVSQSELS